MQPTKQSINDIFSAERRYLVPLYQRSYVWSREKQWEPLWHDIEQQAISALYSLKSSTAQGTHFLGAIVISARKTIGLAHPISEIIDGQQRLTTFQLFLASFRDLLAKTADDESLEAIKKLTRNAEKRSDPDGRHKVWPTNSDRETFVKVTTAGSRENLEVAFGGEKSILKNGPKMAEAYLFFYDSLDKLISGSEMPEVMSDFSAQDRIDALIIMLRDKLMCVVIELEESDDPQIIFETLNARGQPLLPSDLIRNYLFLEATSRREETDRLYEEYWKPFDQDKTSQPSSQENRFWHEEARQGRLSRPKIDLFMFHFISMNAQREVNIGQLYTEFRHWQSQEQGSIENVLQQIAVSRDHFRQILEPGTSDRLELFAGRVSSLDTSTVYPVLLYLMQLPEACLDLGSRNEIIDYIESYMVRRFISNLTPKNYNRFFITLLGSIKSAVESSGDIVAAVRSELMRPTGPAGRWPNDDEFERGWLATPVYVKSRPDRSAMLLKAIEKEIRSNKSESVSLPDDLTVEHILPQSATEETHPFGSGLYLMEYENPETGRQRLINTIGNLTLLTGPLNSSVGTGSVQKKIKSLSEHSLLRLNLLLQKYEGEAWTEDEVVARGRELFQFARNIWKGPDADI